MRPAGNKREYYKYTLAECEELGVPLTDYLLYLPEIRELEVVVRRGRGWWGVISLRPGRSELDTWLLRLDYGGLGLIW